MQLAQPNYRYWETQILCLWKALPLHLCFNDVSNILVLFLEMAAYACMRGWLPRCWGGAEGFGLPTASWGGMMMSSLVSSFPLFSAYVLTRDS